MIFSSSKLREFIVTIASRLEGHMEDTKNEATRPMRFNSVLQAEVPKGRDGKHKEIVTQLLSDIEQLNAGSALKIPLADLPDSKENIRAALSRAANQQNLHISTSSNEEFLYVWKTSQAE
jgi:hypothetical protein